MPVDPAPAGTVRRGPSNMYPGKCVTCGQNVPAQAGERFQAQGSWKVKHHADDPACKAEKVTVTQADGTSEVRTPTTATEAEILEVIRTDAKNSNAWRIVNIVVNNTAPGGFAVPSITGVNDLTFFRIKVNMGRVNPEKKGQHYFAIEVGGKGDITNATPAYILKAIRAIDEVVYEFEGETFTGRDGAERHYGHEFITCGRCGIRLTDKDSRKRGMGSDCAAKG